MMVFVSFKKKNLCETNMYSYVNAIVAKMQFYASFAFISVTATSHFRKRGRWLCKLEYVCINIYKKNISILNHVSYTRKLIY